MALAARSLASKQGRPFYVSRQAKIPLYHQIAKDLRERIRSGQWRPGELIPPEARLCELYGASKITVRRALSDIVASGLLDRVQGKGTFVREAGVAAGARGLTSFTREMEALGLRPGARLLKLAKEMPAPEVAAKLQIACEEPVVVISRVRLGDDRPIAVQTSHLVASRFPGLEEVDLDSYSLYNHLARVYGVLPFEAEEVFRVVPIRGQAARDLEVRPGSCGFRVERLTRDMRAPYEFVVSTLRGDRYEVRLRLQAEEC